MLLSESGLKKIMLAVGLLAAFQLIPPAQAQEWSQIEQKASGQTVYWNAWGGDEAINAYIRWVGERVAADYGVTVEHVKLADTADAVRKVVAEKSAGRNDGGSVDLIWINGENFKAMKDQALLHGPITDTLPNYALIDTKANPAVELDFTIPTEGLESPWGQAKLVFIYDNAIVQDPPKTMMALQAYALAHPGRVTYPAPPQFLGTTFLKQALYEVVETPDALLQPAGDNFESVTAPLWAYLDKIHPALWREGRDYPDGDDALIRLLDEGAVDFALSFHPGRASSAITQGLLPDTARTFVLDGGTIGNTHYVAIPYNAAHKEGAMVLANFLLSPEAQAHKQDPDIWGDMTVLTMDKLAPEGRALFDALPRGIATLSPAELGPTLPEPHPSWMTRIENKWLERYGS
ncbi:ABC transporter substrate-binding protein [Hwanghaeella sp. 1Z406]|jgi:putative thiamine transport system substrate-binding protein|uniref:ABC transporter substrate-binding protein n=1 Tax=Hwanghaeella sp. 1Z406 TaxID=3402811 RepID=UPI0026809FCE|tara:strand:+ start:215 stop:1429 length:1215 start_codon:yes stop_codon:yes gene_type:complete